MGLLGIIEDFSTYAISKLPTFREDFSDYINQTLADASWVTTDTAKLRVDITNEVADFDPSTSTIQDEKMAFDLVTPLSDEKWTFRCVIDHTNITIGGDTTSTDLYIGLADNASTSWDANQNFIGCALRISNGVIKQTWRASFSVFDSTKPNSGGSTQNFGGDVFTSDVDGIEIKRISSSILRVTRFNQDFTTVIGSVDIEMDEFNPSPTGLQFIKIGTFNADGTGDSTNIGTIDNIEIWAEETTVTTTTPTFVDRFDTDDWIDHGTGYGVNTSTEVIDVTIQGDVADNRTEFDFGAGVISDTAWTLRYKLNISSLASNATTAVHFGFSDTDASQSGVQDSIISSLDMYPASKGYAPSARESGEMDFISDFVNGVLQGNRELFTFVTATDYYVELKRINSTTVTLDVFSDAGFTTTISGLSTQTVPSTIINLRYLRLYERQGVGSGTLIYTIDDVEFFNGVLGGAQQGDVTFKDDFTLKDARFTDDFSVDNWTTSNATFINVSGGVNNFDLPVTTTVNAGSIVDLGAGNVSDTSWVLRAKLDVTTYVTNTDPTGQEIHVGISDSDQTVFSNVAQDYIGLKFSGASSSDTFNVVGSDGIAPTTGGAIIDTFTRVPTVELIFIEIIRTSATEIIINQYSDSTYETLLESAGGTISGITGLRYIKIMAKNSDGTADGDITGLIDDLEFYNGVSTITRWLGATGNDVGLDTVDERINFDIPSGVDRDELLAHDLQSSIGGDASDTNWTLRFKLDTDSITQGSSEEASSLFVGLDSNLDPTASATHDLIALRITIDQGGAGPQFGAISGIREVEGGGYFSGGTATNFPIQWATGTLYVEVKRVSSTLAECTLYSDANYRDVFSPTVQVTVADTLGSLRYIRITTDSSDVANDSPWDGSIDDVEFYNNVSVPQTPVLEEKDYEDTFFEDNFTAMNGTRVAVNTSTEVMDWASSGAVLYNDGEVNDILGKTINTDRWTLRCKLDINTLIEGTDGTANGLYVGFSDDNTSTSQTTQNYLGWRITAQASASASKWGITAVSGVAPQSGGFQELDTPVIEPVTGVFYLEFIRTSATTVTAIVYSDSDFTFVVTTGIFTITDITSLRYLKVMVGNFDGSGDSTFDGTIDNIEFYDGQAGKEHSNIWRSTEQ